jgi:glutamyl-tRNA(Gln) amidotransferase subunit D
MISTFDGYAPEVKTTLEKHGIRPGDNVEVKDENGNVWNGLIMPRVAGDPSCIILKLDNGYNVGIKAAEFKAKHAKEARDADRRNESLAKHNTVRHDPTKPTIVILHVGGTVASRLDYRTGAVFSVFTAEEIVEMYPELSEIANIRARIVFQVYSGNMGPDHWATLAREICKELREEGADGIIITHGTDTMHYTAAALAFMIRDLPIPVLLTGSQRSSDRPSSDAGMNLICAVRFIANTDWAGVGICMHSSISDDSCWILPATKVRKMHTSRRDAFRPINAGPIAKLNLQTRAVEMLIDDYDKKDKAKLPKLENIFEKQVALIKIHPGFRYESLEWHAQHCKGIVLEGTGLGHGPTTHADDFTINNPKLLEKLGQMIKSGISVYMTSQCLYGRVNMNVYDYGRDLLSVGVRPAFMMPEIALVKLGWVLAKTTDPKKVDEMMQTDVAGEIVDRTEHQSFPGEEF